MSKTPENFTAKHENLEIEVAQDDKILSHESARKLGKTANETVAIVENTDSQNIIDDNVSSQIISDQSVIAGESLKNKNRAIDIVADHFSDDIISAEYSDDELGGNLLETEQDYMKAFPYFHQQELKPKSYNHQSSSYTYDWNNFWSYRDTVNTYRTKTAETIKTLAGENEKMPKTDLAVYLDKSARPIKWFVDEFWDAFSNKPKPDSAHLAIDRKSWFEYFGIELSVGEYIKDTGELASYWHLPISKVTSEEISTLQNYLKNDFITEEELNRIIDKKPNTYKIEDKFISKFLDEKITSGEIKTRAESAQAMRVAKEQFNGCFGNSNLKYINDARKITERLRALFVRDGISEEDMIHTEKIMDLPTGLEGKNITVVDEVERSGTTLEIAKHFLSWALPEAANVNTFIFWKPSTLKGDNSQKGQMLTIPFWYPLGHDDGLGRGILGKDPVFYEEKYRNEPTDINRAAYFGSDFLGTNLDYETEPNQKSLNLRKQIHRMRHEYDNGRIL